MKKNLSLLFTLTLFFFISCNTATKAIKDAIDTVKVDRKPINKQITGVNAFANDSRFGSASAQYNEVKNVLGLRHVRVLMNWDNGVQPSPGSAQNFSFYDSLINAVPSGVDVLIVTTEVPSWMRNSANWVGGSARTTVIEKWIAPLASRYGNNGKVVGIQLWNEPNMESNSDNELMGFINAPEMYASFLTGAAAKMRQVAPRLKVVNAATTAINQNHPSTLDYNKDMVAAGVADAVDIYAIHYYGEQFERVLQGGIKNFLNNDINRPIWVTESGEQGVNKQLRYVERAWPFLKEKIPGIERFYYYQLTEATPSESTYALRNLTAGSALSDLYIWLRDNN
jgi:hypothetical protein